MTEAVPTAVDPDSLRTNDSRTAVYRRVVAMAKRLFDVPVAAVLTRGAAGWRLVEPPPDTESIDPLVAELLRHGRLIDHPNDDFVVVPDFDDDARVGQSVDGAAADGAHLRFLAAVFLPGETGGERKCICLLDSRPRQLRSDDRRVLGELAGLTADAAHPANTASATTTTSSPSGSANGHAATLPPLPTSLAAPGAVKLTSFLPHGASAPPAARTADLTIIDRDLSAPAGNTSELEARVRELTKLNESLQAELASHTEGELSRARLEQLLEESPDFVALANLDGRVYHLNQSGRRMVGLDSLEDARRTRVIDYLMREDRSFFLGTVVPTVMRTGRWAGDSGFRNFKTGASIPVNWNVCLIRDPVSGDPAGMATFARDTTERQKAEAALKESEGRFRHLVEQAGEAIFVYDLTGRLIDVNQEACDSLGYTRAELLMMSTREIDADAEAAKNPERWKTMVPGVPVTLEGLMRRKDRTTFPTEARVAAFRSEGQKLVLALVRDITERKRAQETLEARVRERTAELARANDDLRGSERRFASMTANVPGMVYQLLLHPDGTANFPYVSGGCRQLFGLEPAQMEADACTLLDLIHEDTLGSSSVRSMSPSVPAKPGLGRGATRCLRQAGKFAGCKARRDPKDDRKVPLCGTVCSLTSRRASVPRRKSRTAPARPPSWRNSARARSRATTISN